MFPSGTEVWRKGYSPCVLHLSRIPKAQRCLYNSNPVKEHIPIPGQRKRESQRHSQHGRRGVIWREGEWSTPACKILPGDFCGTLGSSSPIFTVKRKIRRSEGYPHCMVLSTIITQWLQSPLNSQQQSEQREVKPRQWVQCWMACVGVLGTLEMSVISRSTLFSQNDKVTPHCTGLYSLVTDVRGSPSNGCFSQASNYNRHRRLTDVIIVSPLWLNSFCMSDVLRFSFSVLHNLYKELTCVFNFLQIVPP